MKSFEQLARAAYHAYRKKVIEDAGEPPQDWAELDLRTREAWVAAAKQMWAELAAVH